MKNIKEYIENIKDIKEALKIGSKSKINQKYQPQTKKNCKN